MGTVSNNYKHTASAQVGKDTIENVTYYVWEHTPSERVKTFKDKLEDLWDNLVWPIHRLKHIIRDAYWEVRYGFQRMFKGYDAVDTFETFAKFVERYEKILKCYKEHHHGYPSNLTEKEWEKVIDDMLYHIYYMSEHNVEKELCRNMPEDWTPSAGVVYEIMERHKNNFFELFSKYFYNLWD